MGVHWPNLEALGEDAVRHRLAKGQYGPVDGVTYKQVKAWVDHKRVEKEKHDAGAHRRREERAEHREELRDEDARSAAGNAKVLAWVSIAIAIVALLISLFRG